VQEHFSPELLPKDVCPRAVVRAIEKEMQPLQPQSNNLTRAFMSRHYRLGSLHFELASYRDAHPEEGMSGTEDRQKAEEQFDTAAQRSPSRYTGTLNSCLLRLFMPYANQVGLPLGQKQAWELQDGLSDLAIKVMPRNTSAQPRGLSKIGSLLLFTTRGILAVPATARESGKPTELGTGSNKRPDNEYAHDFYIVDSVSGRKVPHRLIPEEQINNTAHGIHMNFNALAMQAVEEVSPPNAPSSPEMAGKFAVTLLHRYADDRVRNESSLRVLDTMGAMAEEQIQIYTENHLR